MAHPKLKHCVCCEGGEVTFGCFHDHCTGPVRRQDTKEFLLKRDLEQCFTRFNENPLDASNRARMSYIEKQLEELRREDGR